MLEGKKQAVRCTEEPSPRRRSDSKPANLEYRQWLRDFSMRSPERVYRTHR